MEETWLTREQAAEWLSCSTAKISDLVREMERNGYEYGIFREGRPFLRINKAALNDYIFHRHAIRMKGRKDERKKRVAG